jgi:hypothetical protein
VRLSIAVSMTWWADVGDLKTDVATMKTDIADTKAVTEDVKKWKLMGMGALGVTGIAAGAIASFITAYWSDINEAASRRLRPHPDPRPAVPGRWKSAMLPANGGNDQGRRALSDSVRF